MGSRASRRIEYQNQLIEAASESDLEVTIQQLRRTQKIFLKVKELRRVKAVIITQKLQKATALTMEEIRERKENRKHNCYEKLKTLQGMILRIS